MLSCSTFIFFVVTDFFEYEDQDSDLGPSQNLVLPQQQEWEEVSVHMEADIVILSVLVHSWHHICDNVTGSVSNYVFHIKCGGPR